MNKGRNTALLVVIVIIIIGAFLWYNRNATWLAPLLGSNPATQSVSGQATYSCAEGKTIAATYYTGTTTVSSINPSEPPTPNGSVALALSDGRNITLPQTISGSGIRYANADESLVFWSKGNTAFVTEGTGDAAKQTFSDCMSVSNISGQESWNIFASSSLGYTIKYPAGFTVMAPYTYEALGPGKSISGVKFTIPANMTANTNLSQDSYISVEQLPASSATCSAVLFMGSQVATSSVMTMTDKGVTYSMAQSSDAAAGNRYDEEVYAIPGSSQCTAVRYFIHYGAIGNYPAGSVHEFDEASLKQLFDQIRQSLVLNK